MKEDKIDFLDDLSKTKKKKFYEMIISSFLEYILERDDNSETKNNTKIEYFGDIISDKKYTVTKDRNGNNVYAY